MENKNKKYIATITFLIISFILCFCLGVKWGQSNIPVFFERQATGYTIFAIEDRQECVNTQEVTEIDNMIQEVYCKDMLQEKGYKLSEGEQ